VKFDELAAKQLKKMDPSIRKRILEYIRKNLEGTENPRVLGDPLIGDKTGLWRYRVSNYRIICELLDETLIIDIIRLGHRKDVYK
jgi:mRNA interferase RelE/StbE